VVSYHQLHEPVVVEIGECDSTAHLCRLQSTVCFLARFDELPVAFVVKQGVELLVVDLWHGLFDLGIDVAIGYEQIQPAIIVVVEEATAETQYFARWYHDPRRTAHVIEETFPAVVPEVVRRLLEIRDVEVQPAIVVIVTQ